MKDSKDSPGSVAHRSGFARISRSAVFTTAAIATLNLIIVGSTGWNPLAALCGQLGIGNDAVDLTIAFCCLAGVALALRDMQARLPRRQTRLAAFAAARIARASRTSSPASRARVAATSILGKAPVVPGRPPTSASATGDLTAQPATRRPWRIGRDLADQLALRQPRRSLLARQTQ